MNDFNKKISDVLLYPAKIYSKLTNRKVSLIAGIILIGIIDFFSADFIKTYTSLFTGKPNADIGFNIVLAVFMILILGLIDVAFFSIPMYDLFKFIKKKDELPHEASLIKVMKIYIMTHFIFIPVNIALYYIIFKYVNENSSPFMINLSIALTFLMLIWFAAILTRGINTIFNFNPLLRRFTFIIIFTWNFLLNMVFSMQIQEWLMGLFR